MSRTVLPKSLGLYQERRPFWLLTLLQSLLLITISYLTAFFTYLIVIYASGLPHGPLWDESFQSPLAFILVVIASIGLMIPYFQKEWDRSTRLFSIFSAFFLLSFSSLASLHIADPATLFNLIVRYAMDPLRHLLRF